MENKDNLGAETCSKATPQARSGLGPSGYDQGESRQRLDEFIGYLDAVEQSCFVIGGRRIYTDDLRTVLAAADKLAVTVRRIYAEQLPDTWFVCGEGGSKDRNGLPDNIRVCPAYGVSWTQVYERRDTAIVDTHSKGQDGADGLGS